MQYTRCFVVSGKQRKDDFTSKNESKKTNNIFLLKPLYSRKSSLKIYRVYLKLANPRRNQKQ